MRGKNTKRSYALLARGFIVLGAVLGLGLMARPAAAAAFAYVTNESSNTVSVIDTATNMVVATVPVTVGNGPLGVAVTPDGKRAYVANLLSFFSMGHVSFTVSVIDTASNKVVATVTVGPSPFGVAITPDGKHAYVANGSTDVVAGTVSVIDTATNKVVATVTVGISPHFIAITPDGKHAYVTNQISNTVSVIDTATNKVVATVPAGITPTGIAITPDGKRAYVTNCCPNAIVVVPGTVSVIDTASNKVVATVPVGVDPGGVAITPDGKHAYVTNHDSGTSGTVSVIATASNTVVATVTVGNGPDEVAFTPDGKHAYVANLQSNTVSVIATASNTVVGSPIPVGASPDGVGIIPDIPFSAFSAMLEIDFHGAPNEDVFELQSSFTLGSASTGINPVKEPVTLQIGTFATTIPLGSFKGTGFGPFRFHGVIDGAALEVVIKPTGTKRFALEAEALDANLKGTKNPVTVRVSIGNNSATTSVKADLDF